MMSGYCTKKEAEEFFYLAQARKLSDVFSNGFIVPDGLKPLIDQTKLIKYGYNQSQKIVHQGQKVYSLFDVVLEAIANVKCNSYTNSAFSWSVVIENGVLIGFTEWTNRENDNNIITLQSGDLFQKIKITIYRFFQASLMMFERSINSSKMILKSDLTKMTGSKLVTGAKNVVANALKMGKSNENIDSSPLNMFITKINRPVQEQMEDILEARPWSVLNIPDGQELTFPTADLTQNQILYKTQQELLGAVLQMPLTKLFGTPPVGFQSTGEYDRLSYEQTLDSVANQYCVPILKEVANIMGYTQDIINSIKYISVYQIEVCTRLVERTTGSDNTAIQSMVTEIVEAKLGISTKDLMVKEGEDGQGQTSNTDNNNSSNLPNTDNAVRLENVK